MFFQGFSPIRPKPLFFPFWNKIKIGKLPVVSKLLAGSQNNSTTGFLDALASLEFMMSVIVSLTENNWVTERKFSLLQDVM